MRFFKVIVLTAALQIFATNAHAAFGINAGFGLPYASQFGVNWMLASKSLSFDLEYNVLALAVSNTSISLTKPEIMAKWHPMQGSFFIGLGLGQQALTAKGTDATTGQTVSVAVTSMAMTPTVGWMWGSGDGGFWMGLDAGYVMPSGATVDITTALPSSSQAYIDARNQAATYGESAYTCFALRLGYLF